MLTCAYATMPAHTFLSFLETESDLENIYDGVRF